MSTRKSYVIVLEITPTAPLTHGQGTEGNEQILATREYNVQGPDGEWERIEVPMVSGAAVKATLREWAVRDALERAGVPEGAVSKDALRLLLKGGKNDSGGASVSLDEARHLRDLFPLLAVFGSMDGGLPIVGELKVSDARPYTEALVAAGLMPRQVAPVEVAVEGELLVEGPPAIEVYPGTAPIPDHLVRTSVTYYRHDMQSSGLTHYLQGTEQRQIEDQRAGRKAAGSKAGKEQRREANESMPHSMQAIAPGTPMVCVLRLQSATEVEFAALGMAITRWMAAGGHLGGASAKGHGACTVRVAGAIRYAPAAGTVPADPGSAIEVTGDARSPLAMAYDRHVRERADAIRAYVGVSTRAA
jgi:CRISPR type IV-associated protein Csf2